MHLTDRDKQIIKDCIDRDEPLPAKYKLMLFADSPEVELIWQGKSSEVTSVVLPFQSIEQIDEPRQEVKKQIGGDLGLFAADVRGRQSSGWTNKLIWGDNKLVLSSLKNGPLHRQIEDAGAVKLIYIDPPFDVGADFSFDVDIGDDTLTKEPSMIEELAYRDTWGKSGERYIQYMYERLKLMRDLLAEDGSIYVHCDWRVTGYIRQVMDEVFGKNRFINEIIWKRQSAKSGALMGQLGRIHETIYFYSNTERFTWTQQFTTYDDSYIENFYKYTEAETGRRYRLSDLTAAGSSQGDSGGALKIGSNVVRPAGGRHWALGLLPGETVQQAMDRLIKENRICKRSPHFE
jgi:hypothetical protein